ncbi:GrpB family protein, partial [Bacillus thuringiensis]|nr:GrpB family protein [Bacillus thuringiensis]
LKIQLSQANPTDKHKYAEDKTNFITSVISLFVLSNFYYTAGGKK